ncbi:glycosyltransferase family 2 protein [Oenococcus oeni]|uniref:glycosyltransferase family 2 protein n=1 Tax=Oenococcus oeni TaxID=1247 RepID=UPI0007A75774|nr:glycosyltransferase family 2 protein [Oenococcus oeni]KZD14867.1 Glycosyltransferase PglI [Oenococcus oeni]
MMRKIKKPSVDVVIPTYERPKEHDQQNYMLQDALESVLEQTYPVNDIFVVIDGKSLISKKIVTNFHDNRIKVIESVEKKGGGSARNLGIRASNSDFIAFLDDDDLWIKDKIEKQIKSLSCYSSYDLVFSFSQVKSEKKGIHGVLPKNSFKEGWSFAEYIFLHNGYITTSTIMASRALLQENMFTERLPKHQDWDWLFKANFFFDVKAIYVAEPLTVYRTKYIGRLMSVSNRNLWHFSYSWIRTYGKYLNKQVIARFDRDNVITGILDDRHMTKSQKTSALHNIFLDLSFTEKMGDLFKCARHIIRIQLNRLL